MASADAAARKTVTVLFCDLADSTALGERLDPESLRDVMSRWYEAMCAPIERHGGTVEKFVGDAVMAVFGVPRVHEDDGLRAVQAAVELREELGRLNRELADERLPELSIRVGLNSGEVVTGDGDTTLVTGDAVNTAKRLEQAAGADEILIGATTRRLVDNAVLLEPVEAVEAKGKRRPVEAWRVLATIRDAPPFARRLDAPLVGRSGELELLRAELAAAERDRSCRLVTVLGPAGIGKSRLAVEFVAGVRGQATVLSARCLPYGDGITFWPLTQLVRDAGGREAIEAAVADEPDGGLIMARIDSAYGGGRPVSADETFWALRRLLETLARVRPLVVVLEDLHWGEPTFLDLVDYVARWSRDAPILLLCLARPELLDERPRWDETPLALEPLSGEESEALLDRLSAERPLTTAVRGRIAAAAEGNPLFVEQMVAMLSDGGGDEEPEIPPSIQALLAARLDRLEPLERRVLERAAVIGREFWRGALVELLPAEERPGVGSTLLRLVRKDLVHPGRSSFPGEDGFRFRHVLIRDAAYAALPKAVRAELHERFAGWLEGAGGEPEFIGYHLEQAWLCHSELGLVGPETERLAARAGALLADCGVRAFARGDMPAARSLLSRAFALTTELPLDLRRRLSLALWSTGEVEQAVQVLDEVIAEAESAGDDRTLWLARIEAVVRQSVSDPDFHVDEIVRTSEQAIAVFAEHGDEAALARAWLWTAYAHRIAGRLAAGSEAAEIGLRHAAAGGAPEEQARLEDELCTALLDGPGGVEHALARCEELLAGGRDTRLGEANVLSSVAGLRALNGDFDGARGAVVRAAELYRELGMPFALAGLRKIAGDVEVLAGDLDAAEAELREGLGLISHVGARAIVAASLAHVLVSRGLEDEARALVADAEEVAGPFYAAQVLWRSAKARLLSVDGSGAEPLPLAREAVALAAGTDALVLRGQALVSLAQVASAAGAADEAAAAAAEALEAYRRKGGSAGVRWASAQLSQAALRL